MTRKYKVICPQCSKSFYREDEEYIHYKNRYYHKDCYNIISKVTKEKQELEDFIKELFNLDNLSPLIKKQIKEYHENEDYNYSYSGMKKTLDYFFNVKKGDKTKSRGIGIIPFIYQEAKQYYYNLFLIEEKNAGVTINSNIINIEIKKPIRNPLTKVHKIVLELEEENE